MFSSHNFHIRKGDIVEVKTLPNDDNGYIYFIQVKDYPHNDINIHFEDCEHLQEIITSLQKQLDEIKEKG